MVTDRNRVLSYTTVQSVDGEEWDTRGVDYQYTPSNNLMSVWFVISQDQTWLGAVASNSGFL